MRTWGPKFVVHVHRLRWRVVLKSTYVLEVKISLVVRYSTTDTMIRGCLFESVRCLYQKMAALQYKRVLCNKAGLTALAAALGCLQ